MFIINNLPLQIIIFHHNLSSETLTQSHQKLSRQSWLKTNGKQYRRGRPHVIFCQSFIGILFMWKQFEKMIACPLIFNMFTLNKAFARNCMWVVVGLKQLFIREGRFVANVATDRIYLWWHFPVLPFNNKYCVFFEILYYTLLYTVLSRVFLFHGYILDTSFYFL